MIHNGQTYCDFCFLLIGLQKHATFRKPGTKGQASEDYQHYHNRNPDDCWGRQSERLAQQASMRLAS